MGHQGQPCQGSDGICKGAISGHLNYITRVGISGFKLLRHAASQSAQCLFYPERSGCEVIYLNNWDAYPILNTDDIAITRLNFASKTVHLDWYLNLTFRGHPRSKIFSPFESPYMTSYLISIDTFYLVPFSRYSTSKFLGFDLDLWPLGVTWGQIFPPLESPYMTSYSNPIDTFSLSRTVFEIFDFKVFRVWPWPLTFRGDPKSKIFPPFESPYMTPYSTPIDTFSLSRTVFEIFDFEVFRVWPWPLGVTRGQTYFHHLKAHLWLPIQLPLTLSLSCTVFEIFDFKVFRVWSWPLTFRGHLRSNIFSPFESPYMTSYLTSIDTFSLYRTVFEIFDFKVFRVWPWPLTFRGHLRSNISTIGKPIYDFLFNSHWHFLSILYRFRDIRFQSF